MREGVGGGLGERGGGGGLPPFGFDHGHMENDDSRVLYCSMMDSCRFPNRSMNQLTCALLPCRLSAQDVGAGP